MRVSRSNICRNCGNVIRYWSNVEQNSARRLYLPYEKPPHGVCARCASKRWAWMVQQRLEGNGAWLS